jgi:SNF2-related domain/Helicase conserved C-terminal domain
MCTSGRLPHLSPDISSQHFIVVCPSSLVNNWAKEFDKWVGKASQPKRVILQSGNDASISRLKATYSSTKSMGGKVLILSFDLFRRVTQNIRQSIGLLVIDEAHKIKNQGSQIFSALASIPCEARLIVTATPVQNNLKEFFTLANFVRPGILGELTSFRREFEKPITAANHRSATRLAKDTIERELPPREQVLLFCRPTQTQAQMYGEMCRKASGVGTEALTALLDLRKLCTHPGLLEKREVYMKLSNNSVALSGKLCVLEALLLALRDEGDKVVIVSNFTSVLSLIEATILRPKQLSFVRLDGSTDQSDRQALVDNFNRPNSSVFAFLLSSRAGGCGLTLTGGTYTIFVTVMHAAYCKIPMLRFLCPQRIDLSWWTAIGIQRRTSKLPRESTGLARPNPATFIECLRRGLLRKVRKIKSRRDFSLRLIDLTALGVCLLAAVILQRQITKEALGVLDNSKSSDKFNPEEIADCFTLKDCDCDTKKKLGPSWPDYCKSLARMSCMSNCSLVLSHALDCRWPMQSCGAREYRSSATKRCRDPVRCPLACAYRWGE